MDDITIGGTVEAVAKDVNTIVSSGDMMGLLLNTAKCELIAKSEVPLDTPLDKFIRIHAADATLLGAPLSTGPAMDIVLSKRLTELRRASDRLQQISSHDALFLLKASCGAPKLLHVLRAAPCTGHATLGAIDNTLRSCLTVIANVNLTDIQWAQATLPVKSGGLGLRSSSNLALSTFLASATSTQPLQQQLLRNCLVVPDLHFDNLVTRWTTANQPSPTPSGAAACKQRSWDSPSVDATLASVLASQIDDHSRARLLAASAPHSGDWLHALPLSACGLRLDDEAIRVAVCLRLGINLCDPHKCPCGAQVDSRGTHGLSCKHSLGRLPRHAYINDLVHRALIRAGIPAHKEPAGLFRSDGKRPDGLTLVPWSAGKSVLWDVTVIDTLAQSYLPSTSTSAGSAAEIAALRKEDKYASATANYTFIPIALETLGAIGTKATSFLRELGRRLSLATDDPRETAFLFQRLSVALQQYNAVCFRGSFLETLLLTD